MKGDGIVKLLIYLGCILVASIFQTFLQMYVGLDSPLLIFLGMLAMARFFCKKWDEHHSSDKGKVNREDVVAESHGEQVPLDSTEECVQEKVIDIQTLTEAEGPSVDNFEEMNSIENCPVIQNSGSTTPFDILKQLKELHNEGTLTDEEYTEKKKEILKRI